MQDTVNSFTRSLIVEELRSKRCQQYAGSEILSKLADRGMLEDQTAPVAHDRIRQMVKQEMEKMAKKLEEGI